MTMQSSGTKLSDLKAAILKDAAFYEDIASMCDAGNEAVQAYAQRTLAVREEMAEWMVGLVDPAKITDNTTFFALAGLFRIRLTMTMASLILNHDKNPAAFALYWDGRKEPNG